MTGRVRCQAVYAGLMGLAVSTLPIPAQAATLTSAQGSLLAMTLPPFALGCVTGGVAGAAVALVVSRRRDEADIPRVPSAAEAHTPRNVAPASAQHSEAAGIYTDKASARQTPRHLRTPDWESTGNIRVQAYSEPSVSREPAAPAAHEATDYIQIAENYVRRMTIREIMATRARDVRDVLAERLGQDPMEGMPIITRADGSTGDVGTSWWNAAVGDRRRTSFDGDLMDDTAQKLVHHDIDPAPVNVGCTQQPAASAAAAPKSDSDLGAIRSRAIVSRIAYVEQGLYPEKRSLEDTNPENDVWSQALNAMDESASSVVAVAFEDAVGGADTIDDPEGLEDSTSFIPFRAPAGHPEVVDKETYVDYLINEEFSRNRSASARKSSRSFLQVIEGGSQRARRLITSDNASGAQEGTSTHRAAHFAEAREA